MLTLNASTKLKYQTLIPNANTKRKHQTQALMGATRLASGQIQEKSPRQNEIAENTRRETRRPH